MGLPNSVSVNNNNSDSVMYNGNSARKHGESSEIKIFVKVKRKYILFLCMTLLSGFYVITPMYKAFNDGSTNGMYYFNSSFANLVKNNLPALPLIWNSSPKRYLVYTNSCKLLDMDAFDESVLKFVKNVKPHKCNKPLIIEENQVLKMDASMKQSWKYSGSHCCYRKITRISQKPNQYNRNADWGIAYSKQCFKIPTDGNLVVNDSYIKVECENENKIKTSVDFHGIVLPPEQLSPKVRNKLKKWDEQDLLSLGEENVRPPNVLILGIDSISRLHMIRSLPKTKSFLQSNDFIEMQGYTKIGENTFPNMMGVMAGMKLNEYGSCWTSPDKKVDDCPFIWKNFSNHGYLTALVEDSPGLAIFNYAKVGFVNPPVDYYLRPVMAAQHTHLRIDRNSGLSNCLGGGLTPTNFLMKYIRNILALSKQRRYPNFVFSWFTSIGHDDFNLLKTEDENFQHLLQQMVTDPKYDVDNTVIFFISDHGYRFGAFRETFLGFYEESLPFFFVRIPPKLKQQFPDWYINLKLNSKRLTSPLDFHETLREILALSSSESDFARETTKHRETYSFFESTPNNRSCETSGIPNQYCMCGVVPELSTSSDKLQGLAKIVLNDVNKNILREMISKKSCVMYKFKHVLYGRLISQGEVWNNFGKLVSFNMYLVAFEVNPGSVRFEAKIKQFENGTESIQGDVNRINSYQGQSDCMADGFLKKYCFCQNVLGSYDLKKKRH